MQIKTKRLHSVGLFIIYFVYMEKIIFEGREYEVLYAQEPVFDDFDRAQVVYVCRFEGSIYVVEANVVLNWYDEENDVYPCYAEKIADVK